MRYLLILLLGLSWIGGGAQTAADTDAQWKMLSEKNAEYRRKTSGEYDGYRIKIHFGIDKTLAREVKQKFEGKYPDIQAYEDYRQPNFVIVVGDFKTRVEAYEALKRVQADFPNAFLVKSKIKPGK